LENFALEVGFVDLNCRFHIRVLGYGLLWFSASAARPLCRQGKKWFSSLHGLLMPVPVGNRVDFLRCESWKYKVWILGLAGQSLGFIQGELEHVVICVQRAARLGKNRTFGLPDLRENLPARSQAERAERASATDIHPNFIRLLRLNILVCLSLYVITVVT
jgi:hypothetical protein